MIGLLTSALANTNNILRHASRSMATNAHALTLHCKVVAYLSE